MINVRLVAADTSRRVASWLRKDYPKAAPAHGHCPLIVLNGTDRVTH